ncbi:TIR domain-containing protein [Pseudomonas helleri]|uniref:TIR domain-containing protein n=1 Tax=Pseudomonas helleri TaxID=1608996 RepID=UPI003807073D
MSLNKIFISYSWDSEEHKNWTLHLADRLEQYLELNITFDQYDLDSLSDKNHFMEKAVFENDLILVVVTEKYTFKANSRLGGAGIETKLSSSRHWEETDGGGTSKIIPILREGTEVPRYLKEKFYIDFRPNDSFEKSFETLIKHIKGQSRTPRPKKILSLLRVPAAHELTRGEDFLKINHKKRTRVFEACDTTDFSSRNRIKFELWETRSPTSNYYLLLFNNITIKSTIDRFCSLLKRDKIYIVDLTVLKMGASEKGYLKSIFASNKIKINLTELTYQEYMWDFCIDEDSKSASAVYTTPNFIDQSLISCDDQQTDYGPAFDYIKKQLINTTQSTANFIIAPGGTGKTTLCQYLTKHYQSSGDVIPILLQSEELKVPDRTGLSRGEKIRTVYDLYETYINSCTRQDEEPVFDKLTFEVALLTGKIILIIDGLDELISLFPDGFDIDSFLSSIDELNKELASCKVILTSRNDVISDDTVEKFPNINKYKLLGFDIDSCEKYLSKRFKKFDNDERMIKKVLNNIEPLISKDEDERILPFIVDLLSSLVEGANDGEEFSFELSFDGKEYESNSDITDYLVYSILRRESVRQSIEIPINEVLDIFVELAATHRDSFPKSELEDIVKAYYSENADSLTSKLLRNPLIQINGAICKFKYDFIADYFCCLKIINGINKSSKDEDLMKLCARNAYGDTPIFKDVGKYFSSRTKTFMESSKKIISHFSPNIKQGDAFNRIDYNYKAISFFINIASNIHPAISKTDYTRLIVDIFGGKSTIHNLSMYGDSKPLDFTNLHILNSRFVGYKNFTASKFENTKFSGCFFEHINNKKKPEKISSDMFDSCVLGDLEVIIDSINAGSQANRSLIEKELRKFFGAFFQRGKFKDQKKSYIKFSDRVRRIDGAFFNQLLQMHAIQVKAEKSDETYYEVSSSYQDSVYSLINNSTIDKKMNNIIGLIM